MDDARIGLTLDGRYRIEKRLAAGGMGVVYRAERIGLAKKVAIKFLHRSQASVANRRQRFEREAAAMSRLSHPNLVSIIDFGELDDTPYLVMEFHKGASLRSVLERGPLAPARAVHIARQLLAGLDSAHASGVVHRDLKPDNVLILGTPGEDLVKVLDFGVAKLLESDGGAPSELSVMAGSLLGTAEYMAPEQARCETIDPRTDVYAVGILLYEMLTGRRPFEAERDLAVLRMQVEDPPVPPRELAPQISNALERAVLRALEKDRERRWVGADAFSKALGRTPEGRSSNSRPATAPVAAIDPRHDATMIVDPPPRRRSRAWLWLLVPILAAVGVLLAHELYLIDLPLPRPLAHALGWEREPPRARPARRVPPAAATKALAPAADAAPPDAAPPDAAEPATADDGRPAD